MATFIVALGLMVLATVLAFVGSLITAIPTYFLWAWLAPIFGLPLLTFWQTWGLCWLLAILFKTAVTTKSE